MTDSGCKGGQGHTDENVEAVGVSTMWLGLGGLLAFVAMVVGAWLR